jgi:hypothetical protein
METIRSCGVSRTANCSAAFLRTVRSISSSGMRAGGAQFPEGEHPVSVSEADSWAH